MPFGVILIFKKFAGCSLLCGGLRGMWFALWGARLRATCIWPWYCLIDGWGLVILLGVGLLVVNFLLRTSILFARMCTATTTGRLTWGVVF